MSKTRKRFREPTPELIKKVRSAFHKLNPREKEVVSLRLGLYGNGKLALTDIGRRFFISPERIRQILRVGISKIGISEKFYK